MPFGDKLDPDRSRGATFRPGGGGWCLQKPPSRRLNRSWKGTMRGTTDFPTDPGSLPRACREHVLFTLNRCTLQLNMLLFEHVFHAEPLHTSAKHALLFEHVFHAEPLHTSAKHALLLSMFFTLNRYTLQLNMLSCLSMFFTLNRYTLQLNMLSCLEHVFHAEPLHTSAKHALLFGACFSR
jgi:hypothetical protein